MSDISLILLACAALSGDSDGILSSLASIDEEHHRIPWVATLSEIGDMTGYLYMVNLTKWQHDFGAEIETDLLKVLTRKENPQGGRMTHFKKPRIFCRVCGRQFSAVLPKVGSCAGSFPKLHYRTLAILPEGPISLRPTLRGTCPGSFSEGFSLEE